MLVGDVPGCGRVRGLGDPLLGVAQDLYRRGTPSGGVALPDLLLGEGHSATGHVLFGNLGCHARGYPGQRMANRWHLLRTTGESAASPDAPRFIDIHDALAADGHTILSAPLDGHFGRTFTFADPDGDQVTLHDRA